MPHQQVFKDYNSPGDPVSVNDETLFPEFHFPSDCVPDSALPRANLTQKRAKMEFHSVLDNLPGLVNRSPAMIERFGIMPEYYKVGNKYRGNGGEGKHLTEEQGNAIVRKCVVRFMASAGFESATAGALDVLVEVISRHVCKLGRSLKILTDNYRKQFSAIDLLKMFLQASGFRWGSLCVFKPNLRFWGKVISRAGGFPNSELNRSWAHYKTRRRTKRETGFYL